MGNKVNQYRKYSAGATDEEYIMKPGPKNLSIKEAPRPVDHSTGTLLVLSRPHASLSSGISNLSNTILGAGMLGLPFALASSGIIVGAILFFVAAMATIFGLHLLAITAQDTANQENYSSFFLLAKETFPRAAIFINLAIVIKCLGVAISYLIVWSALMPDAMETIAGNVPILQERFLWLGISVLVCVPLSMLRTMDSLRFISYLALLSVAYVVILIIYYFFHDGVTGGRIHLGPTDLEDFFSSLPTFVFAFTCHQNIFSIRNETPDINKVNKIIVISVLISLSAYIFIGYCGYLTYGGKIKDNIINNLNKTDIVVVICRFAVSILVAFSYPLQIHPARTCINNILESCFPSLRNSIMLHIIITVVICGITYSVAFLLEDLGFVFSLVGATGSVMICYILPGILYTKLYWDDSWYSKKFFAALLAVVGIIFMINSLAWIILNQIKKGGAAI